MEKEFVNAPYTNKSLDIEVRIADLISKMTLKEKIRQLDIYSGTEIGISGGSNIAPFDKIAYDEYFENLGSGCLQLRYTNPKLHNEIQKHNIESTRLGIPILFSEETLHGLVWPECTIFPQQIALAGTFEPGLANKTGHAIAKEARSLGVHEGWSPVLDLVRDPRYGRVEECYGEDTYLATQFAVEMVKGMQGDDLRKSDCIVSEPKHFTGYGYPYGGLNCAPSLFSPREHAAYCLPIFEAAFKAGALNTMCSYSSIDGVPVACDKSLLTTKLRDDWGMKGFVRADMTAIAMLHTCHFVAKNNREAIKMGIEAGVDMQLYDFPHEEYQNILYDLVMTNEISQFVIDTSCSRILRVKFMLGLFDNPYVDETLCDKVVNCDEHTDLALTVAQKAICLLKNKSEILPLKKDIKNIAVIGPSANESRFGDYSATSDSSRAINLLSGIKSVVSENTKVHFAQGCSILDSEITPMPTHWLKTNDGETGLTGHYYNNADLSGEPVHTRNDKTINFNWIYSVPAPNVNSTKFSVKWTGKLKPDHDFHGCLCLSSMDSMRLWVDDKIIIDGWGELDSTQMIDFLFKKDEEHDIVIEFMNDQRGVRVIFGYNYGIPNIDEAVELAKKCDVAIIAVGDSEETCGENLDRADLNLPGKQLELIKRVYETKTQIVLVLQNGRPLSIPWETDNIPAIVEAWHIGEQSGLAIANVLFGNYNPAGRLPMSFPKSVGQIPVNYNRCPFGATKYVEMDWNPLYPFGYGLSYTQFQYSNLIISKDKIQKDDSVDVTFTVKNIGAIDGEEVAQVYIHDKYSCVVRPYKELAGFKRIFIKAGETKDITITIENSSLRVLNSSFEWIVEEGEFEVMIGASSSHIMLNGLFEVI